jgi:hypothetical protein
VESASIVNLSSDRSKGLTWVSVDSNKKVSEIKKNKGPLLQNAYDISKINISQRSSLPNAWNL